MLDIDFIKPGYSYYATATVDALCTSFGRVCREPDRPTFPYLIGDIWEGGAFIGSLAVKGSFIGWGSGCTIEVDKFTSPSFPVL